MDNFFTFKKIENDNSEVGHRNRKKLCFKILELKNKGVYDFYAKAVKEYLNENGLPLDWMNLYIKRLYNCMKNHQQKPSHRLYCNPYLTKETKENNCERAKR